LQRLAYPLDAFRRFEARWQARLDAGRTPTANGAADPDMKARERIDRVRQVLEARWAKRNVRGSLALARRKEAEGVERRQRPRKPAPTGTSGKPSAGAT
jgi:hypothetical protein